MRIAFDVRPALKKNSRRRGIGKYTMQLAAALAQRAEGRHDLLFYGCGPDAWNPAIGSRYVSLFQLAKPSRLAWLSDRFFVPRQLARDRVDVFHSNEITSVVFRKGTCTAVTVHDLIPLVFWDETAGSMPWDYRLALKQAFRRITACDLIITDSLYSKVDICARLHIPQRKVKVVYPGCSSVFRPGDPEESRFRIKGSHGINGRFLFYVGGTDFRKNLPRLIEAFSEIRRGGYPGSLVMAGETFLWDIEEVRAVRRAVARHGLESTVQFPGYVDDQDLPDFYRACDMFVFPSLYEGFGLPVLEALRCGALVLASKASSIPEVAGEAAEYFDPVDPAALVAAFGRLFGDPPRQARLRAVGFERSQKFCWQKAATQLMGEYEELMDSRQG